MENRCLLEFNFIITEMLVLMEKIQKTQGGYDQKNYQKIYKAMDRVNQELNPGSAKLQSIGGYSPEPPAPAPADPKPAADPLAGEAQEVNTAPEGGTESSNESPPAA